MPETIDWPMHAKTAAPAPSSLLPYCRCHPDSSSAAAPPSPIGLTCSGSARSATPASSGRPLASSGEPSQSLRCSPSSSSSALSSLLRHGHRRRSARDAHDLLRRPAHRAAGSKGPARRRPHRRADRLRRHRLRHASRNGPRWRSIGTRRDGRNSADPIFGRPLGFYLFTLPAWQLIAGWLLTLAVLVAILAVLFLVAAGGGRLRSGQFARFRFIDLARRLHRRRISASHAGHSRVCRPLRSPLRISTPSSPASPTPTRTSR